MRNWREFVLPVALPKDSAEACGNIRKNFNYFQTNYGLLYLAYLVFSLITSFWSLVTLCESRFRSIFPLPFTQFCVYNYKYSNKLLVLLL